MLHYISFGSGSSGNCSLLFTEHDGLLIDAGIGVRTLRKHLRGFAIPLSRINGVLVTHDHADHVKSVGSISRDYGLPVYATREVHRGIERNWCVHAKVPAGSARYIEKNEAFEIGEFVVTPFAVPHDSSDNVGYCIRYGDIAFVLMTDIGHLTEEIKSYIGRANYLVIEADYEREMLDNGSYPEALKRRIRGFLGHQSNAECAEAIAENATQDLRHVWLCHLSNENNHPDVAERTVREILRAHGIVAGDAPDADFALDVLRRNVPSAVFDLSF